jgi:hypothetical protein
LKLLLDELYPAPHADGPQEAGIQAATVIGLGLAGSSDRDALSRVAKLHFATTERVLGPGTD